MPNRMNSAAFSYRTSYCTGKRDTRPFCPFPFLSAHFLHEIGEQGAERREARHLVEVVAHVAERPGDVLDVDGVAPRGRLVAERAERLQVPLQRHQVETVAEMVLGFRRPLDRKEIRDQLVDGLVR